jgi:hypothetical protein
MYAIRMKDTKPPANRVARNIRWLTRRRDALLKRLRRAGPFVNGSLVLIARTCGNSAHCQCSRGKKHVNTYLSYAAKGKTKMVYIPVDLEKDARHWSAEYRQLKEVIAEISDLQKEIIRRHVQERRRRL